MPKFMPQGQEDPMVTLCRMAIDTRYEDLPENVISYAKQSILDTMGVIIGGSSLEAIPLIVDFVKDRGGKPESLIPFYGGKVPASEAALAIGPMGRAMDLGEIHEEAAHCSEYVLAALLGAAGLKDKITGKELITAFVVGQEVLIRIGIAFKLVSGGGPANAGGGHWIFGCAAAVGRMLGLSQAELENAQGIARCQTQPHDLAKYTPATLMIRMHHGFICRDGVNACVLARLGITGPRHEVLVGPKGYLGLAKWPTDPEALTRGLGEKWEMLNTERKPFTACKCTHTAAGGLLEQMKEHNFQAKDIAHIDIDESNINWTLACIPFEKKWNPQTIPECQFSMPYVVAAGALSGEIFLDIYTKEARARRDIRELMAKISAREDTSLPQFAARVTTTLKNGTKHSREFLYVKGHPKNPFTEQELVAKFRRCMPYSAFKLSDAVIDAVVEALLNLEKVDDFVSELLLPLTPG